MASMWPRMVPGLAGWRGRGEALRDLRARGYVARDFKRHLKVARGWKPSSVNLALAAVDHFNRFLDLGPATGHAASASGD
jgi:hypothetical protein